MFVVAVAVAVAVVRVEFRRSTARLAATTSVGRASAKMSKWLPAPVARTVCRPT